MDTSCVIVGSTIVSPSYNVSRKQIDFVVALPVKITALFWLINPQIQILEYISGWDGKSVKEIYPEADAIHTLLLEKKELFERRDLLGTPHNLILWEHTKGAFLEIMGYTGTKESKIEIYRLKGE